MTSKWSTVSFFGLGTLLAAGIAAAGCSVSSGGIDDVGGKGTEIPDSSTGTDSSTALCPGNTRQPTGLFAAECQTQLDTSCCSQLTTCFDIIPTDTTKPSDCTALTTCVDRCNYKADGTTACTTDADCTTQDAACLTETDGTKKCHDFESDMSLFDACKGDCKTLAQDDVGTAFDALETCRDTNAAAQAACGGQ